MFLAGIQAKPELDPPIKTFGGDAFGINSHRYVLIPRQLAAGSSFPTRNLRQAGGRNLYVQKSHLPDALEFFLLSTT